MTRILIVDDHPMFREALRSAIKFAFADAEIFEAGSIEAARDAIRGGTGIEIILLDLSLPGTSGFEGLVLLRSSFPRIPIMIVSGLDDPRIVHEAIRLGAAGFVPKSVDKSTLAKALSEVLSGSVFVPDDLAPHLQGPCAAPGSSDIATRLAELTPAQLRVLHLLRLGRLNKQIAHELGVSETTVKAHVSEILRKLNVVSRTQAVIETAQLDFETILGGDSAQPRN
ncbi:MAG: response regulator [Methyloceanibacter sp.]|uniref:response regulator n=1 Tax=Methyloceanibacter sp. TaxID=1965321 RepID=UPI003EE381E9